MSSSMPSSDIVKQTTQATTQRHDIDEVGANVEVTTDDVGAAAVAAVSTKTETMINDDTISSTTGSSTYYEFQDYIPPPPVKILPPAKYKLWIIIFILVYFAEWFANEAHLFEFLRIRGWLSPAASLFLMLSIIVFVLVYTTLDLFVTLFTFKTKDGGKVYGVGSWLKQPRIQWIHNYDNVVVDIIGGIIQILEDGFAMFDAPVTTPSQGSGSGSNNTAGGRGRRGRSSSPSSNHHHYNGGSGSSSDDGGYSNNSIQDDGSSNQQQKLFECPNGKCATTLKIEHRIKLNKLNQYNQWVKKIRRAVKQAPGFLDVTTNEDEEEEEEDEGEGDVEMGGLGGVSSGNKVKEDDGEEVNNNTNSKNNQNHKLLVVYLKFQNIDYLNDWMVFNTRRNILMKELQSMLIQPDIVQIQRKRILPDAFTDLLIRQGETTPKLPPKKWKVWWLTTVALYISISWSNSFLPYYYEQWGINGIQNSTHDMEKRLVSIFIVTFINSYIMVPLLLFIFNPWVQQRNKKVGVGVGGAGNSKSRQDSGRCNRQPWKTLDDGFTSIWSKLIITIGFYGGCLLTWQLRYK